MCSATCTHAAVNTATVNGKAWHAVTAASIFEHGILKLPAFNAY